MHHRIWSWNFGTSTELVKVGSACRYEWLVTWAPASRPTWWSSRIGRFPKRKTRIDRPALFVHSLIIRTISIFRSLCNLRAWRGTQFFFPLKFNICADIVCWRDANLKRKKNSERSAPAPQTISFISFSNAEVALAQLFPLSITIT